MNNFGVYKLVKDESTHSGLTKIPEQRTNHPEEWLSFAAAKERIAQLNACDPNKPYGVAFFLSPPFVFLDVDNVPAQVDNYRNGGRENLITKVFETLGGTTYCEVSASGTGLHFIYRGKKSIFGKCKNGNIELYDKGRFCALTGNVLTTGLLEVNEEREKALEKMFGLYSEENHAMIGAAAGYVFNFDGLGNSTTDSTDDEALTDEQVKMLIETDPMQRTRDAGRVLNGESWTILNGDHSSADLALCNTLAIFTGGDVCQMDRLFRSSGCMRPKWDEKHSRDKATYGEITIRKALPFAEQYSAYRGKQIKKMKMGV